MNLMVKMGRRFAHVWTSTGRIVAFVGSCLFAAVGFAAESITITATPRYPWNGKVDLKFTIDGTSGTKYDTSFTAKDVAGGTNLTMKTLYKSNGAVANVGREALLPGTYNWVWDAGEDLTRRWATYSGCVPTNSAVLFANVQLSELSEFYAVPCGKAVSDKSNLAKGAYIKDDGAGKSVQFAFSDDVYTKCVCVHLEQSGANVVGYVKWARYVSGTGQEESDFDTNLATTMGIATSETETGYGLCKLETKGPKFDSSPVLERVVAEGNIEVSAFIYTVKFNANGGTGTMADEPLAYGVPKNLTANAFNRTGYTFSGWATSANGVVVYSDKQSVSNLTTVAGATVNLYAAWKDPLYMVIDLSGGASAMSYPVSYLDAVPSGGWTDEYKTSKLVLRKIKSGSNSAGGSMAKDMWVGVFEVTGQQYYLVKGSFSEVLGGGARYIPEVNPTSAVGCMDNRAYGFLSTLKSKSGVAARLATSVEWQYACRAGTTTDYNNGTSATSANMSKVGWHYGNESSRTTTPGLVGKFVPNAWGLYDMHGNVYEKVSDYYYVAGGGGTYYCGGGYTSAYGVNPNYSQCTSASKTGWDSSGYLVFSGFRVFADVN